MNRYLTYENNCFQNANLQMQSELESLKVLMTLSDQRRSDFSESLSLCQSELDA